MYGAVIVMAASAASMTWGFLDQRPYWAALSMLTAFWALWALSTRATITVLTWGAVTLILASVPILGLALGSDARGGVEGLAAPLLLYVLCVGYLANASYTRYLGPRGVALLAFMTPVTAGSMVLVAMYYLGIIFSIDLVLGNSTMMWNLSFLLGGTLFLTLFDRYFGLQSWIGGREGVTG
ncbi:MAG: hypothetical protein ISF22_08460 [Methanomassiliicoccus sp.]|nr:hypothetical protein [Methanomassiliicoccus sp.]